MIKSGYAKEYPLFLSILIKEFLFFRKVFKKSAILRRYYKNNPTKNKEL